MNLPWIGLLVIVALLTALGHLLFKMAAVGERRMRDRLTDPRFLAGCASFGLAPVLTFRAARHVDFSILYAVHRDQRGVVVASCPGRFDSRQHRRRRAGNPGERRVVA